MEYMAEYFNGKPLPANSYEKNLMIKNQAYRCLAANVLLVELELGYI